MLGSVNRDTIAIGYYLRRLRQRYRDVEIEESDYWQELSLAQAKLSGMVKSEHAQTVTLWDNVGGS